MAHSGVSPDVRIGFGVFELDPRAGELRKRGVKLKLEGQPLQLLEILLECPGQVVTREELQRRLWPDGTFVDFEQGINAAVKRVRQALDDSADTPRYIETLPRRGYRFIYPIDATKSGTKRLPRRRAVPVFAAATVILMAVVIISAGTSVRQRWLGRRKPVVRRVVVLPLENQTGDAAQEYLARGFSDDLTHELSGVGTWDVAPLESAMEAQDSGKAPVEVAKALGADAWVAGTLQRDGGLFRVNLKLVYVPDDRQLAFLSYWPKLEEMPGLPRGAALDILKQASVALAPPVQARLHRQRQVTPEAYMAYSIGRNAYANTITEEGHRGSIDYYQQAIAADPNYAEAYSAMARSFIFLHQLHPREGFKEKAKAAALKAVKLDPELAEPHALLANIKRQDGDAGGAEEEYRLALNLDPSDAVAHHSYSVFLAAAGRNDEALQETLRAEQLDPRSAFLAATVVLRLDVLGRCEEALAQGRKAQQLDPNLWSAHSFTAGAFWRCGRREDAVKEWEKALALPGVYERWPLAQLVVAYAELGRKADALRAFARLRRLPDVEPDSLVAGYAALGRKKEAIRVLQAAGGRVNLRTGRMAERLKGLLGSEPEYQALLRQQATRKQRNMPANAPPKS